MMLKAGTKLILFESALDRLCKSLKLEYAKELKFHNIRKFRFDFAIPSAKLAIEVEGGIFKNGGHTRGRGYMKDLEKYNLAITEGWYVLRYSYETLCHIDTIKQIEIVLKNLTGKW